MAKTLNAHIHLDSVTPPVATYKVIQGTWEFRDEVPIEIERAVTGKLHVHRIVDGVGDPYQFVSDRMVIKTTIAEMVTIKGLAGKQVYFVPIYHDIAHPAGEIITSFLFVDSVINFDLGGQEWHIQIQIADDDTV